MEIFWRVKTVVITSLETQLAPRVDMRCSVNLTCAELEIAISRRESKLLLPKRDL